MRKNNLKRFKYNFFLITLSFLVYFSPYLILGENSFIEPHDNLDASDYSGIFDGYFQGNFFISENAVDYSLPGVSQRLKLHTISIDKILFFLFGYFQGFVINKIIVHLVAFFGMLQLVKFLTKNQKFPKVLQFLSAGSFASLPFYSLSNISIAGLPLLLVCYKNLFFKKDMLFSYMFIFVFGFYSSFITSGFFIGLVIIIAFLFLIYDRKLNIWLTGGGFLLLISYFISHYNIFLIQFFMDINTHRMEQNNIIGAKNFDALKALTNIFYNNHSHAITNHGLFILPSIIVLALENFKSSIMKNWIIALLSYITFSCFIYSISFYYPFVKIFDFISGFSWNRFYWLAPLAWYTLWIILLIDMYNSSRFNINFLFTVLIVYIFFNDNIILHFSKLGIILALFLIWFTIKISFKSKLLQDKKSLLVGALFFFQIFLNSYSYAFSTFQRSPSFKEFYSKNQFSEIVDILNIDKKNDRIGCIGFFPSVANYNGLKTIGKYSSMHDINFKNEFYQIIKGEILQNDYLYDNYKHWGNRVYLFENTIGGPSGPFYDEQWRINRDNPEISCELNIELLKLKGVNFLFSVSKITNYNEIGLDLILRSNNQNYFYNLWVYKIK